MLESRATFDNFTQFDPADFTTGQGGGWEMQTNARFHLEWVEALPEKPNTYDSPPATAKGILWAFLKDSLCLCCPDLPWATFSRNLKNESQSLERISLCVL